MVCDGTMPCCVLMTEQKDLHNVLKGSAPDTSIYENVLLDSCL